MMYKSMLDELLKIASSDVSTSQALKSLERLKQIEDNKPTGGEIARGALAGTAAGTAALTARSLVTGGLVKGVRAAMTAPTTGGKLVGLGKGALEGLGSTAAGSAAFGATLPAARRYLDTEAEKATLRGYLGTSKKGRLRGKVTRVLGV